MDDLKFSDALELQFLVPEEHLSFINAACGEAEEIYRENFFRAITLVTIPGMAFVSGEGWLAARETIKERHPHIEFGSIEFLRKAKELFDFTMASLDKSDFTANFQMATRNAANILCRQTAPRTALHSLLQSVVIHAWTAFEVMAEDLHTMCREKHANCFSPSVLAAKKYHFRRLEELPKSYRKAFADEPLIAGEVENSNVRALGLLRHLIVHKGGKVDQMHIDERMKLPIVIQLDSFGKDSTVELTGTLVCSLVNPVTEHVYRLLRRVDSWLESHKPT